MGGSRSGFLGRIMTYTLGSLLPNISKREKKEQKPSVHQSNNHQKKKKQPGELSTEPRGGYEETSWLVRKNRFPIMRAGEEHPSKWASMNLHNNNNVLYTPPAKLASSSSSYTHGAESPDARLVHKSGKKEKKRKRTMSQFIGWSLHLPFFLSLLLLLLSFVFFPG